jgi:hypothetical protein
MDSLQVGNRNANGNGNSNGIGNGNKSRHGRRVEVTTKKLLVVRIATADGAVTTATEAELANSIFGTGDNIVNLKSQYAACSYDSMEFIPAISADYGNAITITNGVTTVTDPNNNAAGVDNFLIQASVTNILSSAVVPLDWPGGSDRYVMYCMSPGTLYPTSNGLDGYLAYAYPNYYLSGTRTTGDYCS